tara:strand:+ start:979 stop:1680 length:702 start_codon:yes stop_codon:yes gene_type:complete
MSKKVDDELSDPYERIISKTIPTFSGNKDALEINWTTTNDAGWKELGLPVLSVYWEDSIDLSGYANLDLTYFPQLGFIQESLRRGIVGANGYGILDTTIVSSIPLDVEYVAFQLFLGSAPALPSYPVAGLDATPQDWSTVPYCRSRLDILDSSLAQQTRPVDQSQLGSLQPTAADKLFIYRIVIPLSTVVDNTALTELFVPAQRVGFRGMMAQEPQLEYMMRLKRSYELANQV